MIRFSAALVAAAIGVLIGGIATSELVLVYIAIVVSAVALAVLAIAVALKRNELFGEGQGLVPVGAGTSPLLAAQAGAPHHDEDQPAAAQHSQVTLYPQAAQYPQAAPRSWVTPPLPAQEPAVPAPSATRAEAVRADIAAHPAAARAEEARSSAASPSLSLTVPAPAAPGWSANAVSPWGTDSEHGSWAPDQDARSDWTRTSAAYAAPAPPAPAPPAPEATTPPASEPATQATPASWFGRLGEPSANAWSVPSPAPSSGGQSTSPTTPASTTDAATDEDDDEPPRYSWLYGLDDDPADSDSPDDFDDPADSDDPAPPLVGAPTVAVAAFAPTWPAAPASDDQPTVAVAAFAVPARSASFPEPAHVPAADSAEEAAALEPGDLDDALQVTDITGTDVTDAGDIDLSTGTDVAILDVTGTGPADAAEITGTPPEHKAAADAATADQATTEVAVVRGVPRYHEPDCVLIRFMPEADTQRTTIPEAKATGCTPCAACQPPG